MRTCIFLPLIFEKLPICYTMIIAVLEMFDFKADFIDLNQITKKIVINGSVTNWYFKLERGARWGDHNNAIYLFDRRSARIVWFWFPKIIQLKACISTFVPGLL